MPSSVVKIGSNAKRVVYRAIPRGFVGEGQAPQAIGPETEGDLSAFKESALPK
jgi:hypothetical protein